MENELTNEEIDFIMEHIPMTTEMGENTPLWNKLKRLKNKTEQKQHMIYIINSDEEIGLYNDVDNVGIGGETVTNHPYTRDSQQMESAAKKEVKEYWGENDSRAYDDDYINLWKQGAKWQKKQQNK